MEFISGPPHLFHAAASECDLAAIDRIFYNFSQEVCVEERCCSILTGYLLNALFHQIFGDPVRSQIRVDILVKYDADSGSFLFVDDQFPVYQTIAVRGLPAIPAAFPRLLHAAFQRLNADVFFLNLRNGGKNGYDQLSGILGGIDPVFHTDQVHAEVLHDLQCVENICRIPSETGELIDENKRHFVLVRLDILQHLLKRGSPLDGPAGLSGVFILANDLIVVEIRKRLHPRFLRIQRITVDLHGGGNAGVGIDFCSFAFHSESMPFSNYPLDEKSGLCYLLGTETGFLPYVSGFLTAKRVARFFFF